MVDNISKEHRQKAMRSVKSKGTSLEIKVSKLLWKNGFHYRKNVKNLFGKPDFANKSRKVVIFIDSCFWHGCPLHCRIPASNIEYWKSKIQRNKTRDKNVTSFYKENGWKIFRIWEHDIKINPEEAVNKLLDELNHPK